MKLYATTTSERASKGQGGNKYLDVIIKDGDSKVQRIVAQFQIWIENGKTLIKYQDCVGNEVYEDITKGKSQKGEHCRKCEEYHNEGIYHICPDNQ